MAGRDAAIPDPHIIVLFGALGDLSRRKLLPGLFHLESAGLMPEEYRIIGTSRRGGSDDEFREVARRAVADGADGERWERFAARLSFTAFRADDAGDLVAAIGHAEQGIGGEARRLHYLSIPPAGFADTVRALGASGLAERARVVLEKPFGVDLESAQSLNELVHAVIPEERV